MIAMTTSSSIRVNPSRRPVQARAPLFDRRKRLIKIREHRGRRPPSLWQAEGTRGQGRERPLATPYLLSRLDLSYRGLAQRHSSTLPIVITVRENAGVAFSHARIGGRDHPSPCRARRSGDLRFLAIGRNVKQLTVPARPLGVRARRTSPALCRGDRTWARPSPGLWTIVSTPRLPSPCWHEKRGAPPGSTLRFAREECTGRRRNERCVCVTPAVIGRHAATGNAGGSLAFRPRQLPRGGSH